VPNGTLASEPALLQAMMGVLREGVNVSRAELVRIDPPHPVVLLKRVLRATAANRSSMLQDLEQGRTTEIRHLNGAIVALGRKHGIPTPLNELLTSLISTAERLSPERQAAR